MKKVDLRMNEQLKYDIIKKFVDHNSNKKNAVVNWTVFCALWIVLSLNINQKVNPVLSGLS